MDDDPTPTLPKLRLVELIVHAAVFVFVPVPLRLTAVEVCRAALLPIMSVPVAALAVVGANFTLKVTACAGFSVIGKVAPNTVNPVPLTAAELTVSGAVPVEVTVNGSVELDPIATLPKLRLVVLIPSCVVVAATPVLLRLILVVGLVEELLTVRTPVAAPVVRGADTTLRVTFCCGLSVSGKVAPLTVNPVPLTVAELIVTADVPVEVSVTGRVEVDPTVTLPKARLAGLTVNCEIAGESGMAVGENVAICMTQLPLEESVPVALLLPVAVTILSSAISPSWVMRRDVNPLPADAVDV